MRFLIDRRENLAELLREAGMNPDLRCGGRGTCGRCRVTLLAGSWDVGGERVEAPVSALACRTKLAGERGEVEWTPPAANGNIAADWCSLPLPRRAGTVIGIDIGTTTVAAVKIRDGEVIGRASCFNLQQPFGDNVVTRISRAATELPALQQAVLTSVRQLLAELGTDDVIRLAIAGNTVMTLLLHGIDPAPIGMMPFLPPQRRFAVREDLFGIPLYTVPCISGFVGGDLTAGLAECPLATGEMLIDIGTNCEMVFAAPGGMVCSAAAAGPAFEGAGLEFGCRAIPGAIDHYRGEGDFSVLGDVAPLGLCGSAYLDFLAVERRAGRLNEIGRYEPPAARRRVTGAISVSESDLEQLLKAKAAVAAGIRSLEEHCGCRAARIKLAGGFARYLDLASALAVGMLPERDYEIVGNTSLAGAARLAVMPELLPELERLSDLPREIPLNTLPEFEDYFIDGLFLP